MKVYTDISEIKDKTNSVVTIGTFDGVHVGHIEVLKYVVDKSKELGLKSYVITFEPHPRKVVFTEEVVSILTTLEEKKKVFESLGIENLLVINFTREFSKLSSEEFIRNFIVDGIGARHIIIGHDHKFGKDRGGDESTLLELRKKHDFEVTTFSPVYINENLVSSTKIRVALKNGNIESANSMLGRNYSLTGIVVKGAGRGRTLGFPTANVNPDDAVKLIPCNGVYVVDCIMNENKYYGILNIGYRPTFEDIHELVIEVNILDFSKDIYGEEIKIEFLKRLREEKKYKSRSELIEQIEKDKKEAVNFISTLIN
ncbi:MAG: bifunctional riboflavin kinase/FAD synthetase [bacterium]